MRMNLGSSRRLKGSSSARKAFFSGTCHSTSLLAERLEPRYCLSAEFGGAWFSNDTNLNDFYDDIVFDSAGNYYVCGSKDLVKFSPNGDIIWKSNILEAQEMALDSAGNIYLTGRTFGTRVFSGPTKSITVTVPGMIDAYVLKVDANGDPVWARTLGGPSSDQAGGIAVTPDGSVFVSGAFQGTAIFGSQTLISQGGRDAFVAKLSTDGDVQWAKSIGGTSNQQSHSMAVDANGDAYVAGEAAGATKFDGSFALDGGVSGDAYVAKISDSGTFLWSRSMGGTGGDVARSLAIDPAGYVVTTGEYFGPADFDPGNEVFTLGYTGFIAGGSDVFVSKLDLWGNFVWAKGLGGNLGNQVVVGAQGEVFIAGRYAQSRDFNPTSDAFFLTAQGQDPFLVRLNAAGELITARGWQATTASSLAIAPDSSIFVVGDFNLTGDFDPGPGTFPLTARSGTDGFITRLINPGSSLGDFVWLENVGNGIQDADEVGFAGVVVELYSTQDTTLGNTDDGRVATVITDDRGHYQFDGLASGRYYVVVHAPVPFSFTNADGGDDSIDSDFPNQGRSPLITLNPFDQRNNLDVGFRGSFRPFGFGLAAGAATEDIGTSVTTDASGNIYVIGQFEGTVDFDPSTATYPLTSTDADSDVFVAKYTPIGAVVWARRFGTGGVDTGADIKVDDLGNVYVAGKFSRTIDVDPGLTGGVSISAVGTDDIFLIKLDSVGNYVWGGGIGGTDLENVSGIALDADRNIYIAGNYWGVADFDPGHGSTNVFQMTANGNTDAFIAKITEHGQFVWARGFGSTGEDSILDVDVDAAGNAFATGFFSGTVDFDPATGSGSIFNLTSAGNVDGFITKLDTDGSFGWAKRYGNTGADRDSNSISVDTGGNVYTVGGFQAQVNFDPSVNGALLTSAGSSDVFVAKRDNAGQLLWVKRYGGTGLDVAYGVDSDSAGNIFVTGQFSGVAAFGDANTPVSLSSLGSTDTFILDLDSDGETFSAFQLGGTSVDQGRSINFDPLRQVMVTTGKFTGIVDFDPAPTTQMPLTAVGGADMYVSVINKNLRPRFVLLSNQTVVEGQGVQVVGSLSVIDENQGDTFTFELSNDADGRFSINGNQLVANSDLIDFETQSSFLVQLVVTDAGGLTTPGGFIIQVLDRNEAPIISPIDDVFASEGFAFTLNGSFFDADAGDSWTATVDYGDGTGTQALPIQSGNAFTLNHAYSDNGNFSVTVTVTDGGGLLAVEALTASITNVAPENVFISGATTGVRGQTLSFVGSFTDPGTADTHTVTWDFGDDTAPLTLPSSPTALGQQHVFNASGTYTVSFTVTDDDGESTTTTRQVVISAIELQPNPSDPNSTAVVIGGTVSNNVIRVVPVGSSELHVVVDGSDLGDFSGVSKIIVYGQGGDDDIQAAAMIGVDCWFFGGDGNDVLKGGAGNDVVLGEAGDDQMFGGLGRDFLVGGTGADELIANAGGDILISGRVSFTSLLPALTDIMNEWVSNRSYEERVANLKGDMLGEYNNGGTQLLVGDTVYDDGSQDVLIGASGLDWFFANEIEDNVLGTNSNEVLDDLDGWL